MTIDLSPRMAGLLPWWLVLLAGPVALLGLGLLARWRRSLAVECATLLALVGGWALFFWRPLFTAAQVPRNGGDLNSFFFPLHAFTAQTVQRGELPFWNPTLFSGMPHWANYQAGVLYPPNWIAYLLARPFTYSTLELLALSHYVVASLGSYVLARRVLGSPPLVALVPAFVFPYSGFLVVHLGHYSMLAAAVWIPWLWLGLAELARQRRWRSSLLVGAATFLLATGGHQQTVLYGLLSSGLWWLACLVRWHNGELRAAWQAWVQPAKLRHRIDRSRPLLGDGLRALLGIAAGLLLAGPALLPSLELARRSVRAGGLSYEQASEFALQPIALVNLVLPRAFGDNPTNWWGPWASGEVWGYAGVITLILAAFGLLLAREPLRWVLGGIGLLALLHALGPATPVHGWVYRFVPFADLLRAPARTLLYVDLTAGLLAGLGLAALVERASEQRVLLRRSRRALVGAVAALVLLVLPLFLLAIAMSPTPPEPAVRALDNLALLTLWLVLFAAWLRAVERGARRAVVVLTGLALVTLDLFSITAPYNPTSEDLLAGFRHPTIVATVRQASQTDGPWRLLSRTIKWQPSAAALHGLEDAGGLFDPMQPAAYARVLDCARNDLERPVVDLLNVRYIVQRTDAPPPGSRYRLLLNTPEGLAVWENPEALPRAWLAGSASVRSQPDAVAQVCSSSFDPRRELLLDSPLPVATPGVTGTVRVASEGANRLMLEVDSSASAYLVVAVTADPGWRAMLDGRPIPIATADGIYQAVWVPAGRHRVEFRYRPAYLTAGLAAAAVGVAGVGTMVGLAWRERASRVAETARRTRGQGRA